MLTIRFSRIGKRKNPFYRIIISEKQRDTQGKYLELLGHYNPRTKEAQFKSDRITHWLGVGADMSNSVFNLFVKHKLVQSDTKRSSVKVSKKRRAILDEKNKKNEKPKAEAKPEAKPEAETPKEADATEQAPETASS